MTRKPPPSSVLRTFGVAGTPLPLEGGRGSSWRVGDAVLKPLDHSEEQLDWQADVYAAIKCDGFRIAHPLRAESGSLIIEGWCAWEALEGRHEERRWPEIVAVGERFHTALAAVPRPTFIARRTDPWSIGDRVAWGELPVSDFTNVKHLARLTSALKPIEAESQVIHGDLTGNVLFDDRLPPAIIDLAAYWRPPAFASAIVVADALVWEGADRSLLDAVAHAKDFDQYLLRALIYRAVTDRLFRLDEPIRTDDSDPYLPAVELACHYSAWAGTPLRSGVIPEHWPRQSPALGREGAGRG
jgi:uncharacterized protein (TIGR02569 family)